MRDPRPPADLPFDVTELEHETGALPLPNGTVLGVPKTEAGTAFTMACARAAVDARREWHRPA
jgi:hypothetical protein